MALREAELQWPDIAYRADDPPRFARAFAPILDALAEVSPTVEWSEVPEGVPLPIRFDARARYAVFLDGTGLDVLYGSEMHLGQRIVRDITERTGHLVRVGIADGRYAAWLAARMGASSPPSPGEPSPPGPLSPPGERGPGGEGRVVAPGGDRRFLAPLPAGMLPLPPEARERVAHLGVETLGEFARLPVNALRHRFGPDGVAARALAAGLDGAPLRPRPAPLILRDALELEWVEWDLDRLAFLLKCLADRLSVRLRHHGLGCGRLRVTWQFEEGGETWDIGVSTGRHAEKGTDNTQSSGAERGRQPVSGVDAPGAGSRGDERGWPSSDGGREDGGSGGGRSFVALVRLAEPAAGGARLLEHLRWHVEGLRPEAFRDPVTGTVRGVRGIAVEAEELVPLGGRQLALLPGADGRLPRPEQLLAAQRVLARLQARWGEPAVRQAELCTARRPEAAFRWHAASLTGSPTSKSTSSANRPAAETQSSALWLAAEPEPVEVERGGMTANGRRRSASIRRGGRVRRIVRAAGPWRLLESWSPVPIARDTYHVVTSDGAAHWLIHDRLEDRWSILGTFD
ncbi:MAG: hypothetical protein IT305_29570 [Chloroflexi bacterium]|nr:hypothetical protein [Chloroflexota bacterium]